MNLKEQNRRRYELAKPAYDALMKFYPFNVADLQGEIWRPVPDYEQLYHVSNYGRVKSFWLDKVKILKPTLSNGYLIVGLYKSGKQKGLYVHRLVAQAFIPNPDNKPEVNHRDGNRFNNFVGNLEWMTAKENTQHAIANDLIKLGEERHDTKLTNAQVEYVRNNPDALTGRELAKRFTIEPATISDIQLGQSYRNVGGAIRKPQKPGEYHRIPDEIRDQIRADYATGNFTQQQLAKKYDVSPATIWRIIHEK